MSFASNVQITTLDNSDIAVSGRTRLNGLYYTCGSTASTIDLYNGDAVSGDPLVSIATPAAAGAHNVIIPDGGVLFTNGIYVDLGADVASASLVYVGGGKPAVPPTPPVTVYTQGVDYSFAYFNGMGTSGPVFVQQPSTPLMTALLGLGVNDTIEATGMFGTTTLTITVPFTYNVESDEYGGQVTSSLPLAGNPFASLIFPA